MQHSSLITTTFNSLILVLMGTAAPNSQSSTTTTTPVPTQIPATELSIKDFISLVGILLAGLIAIIGTLLWKWHEAEVKRIEAIKDAEIKQIKTEASGEIKVLYEEKKREISERTTKIEILEARIEALTRKQEEFRELNSIAPLEYLKETKPVLENIIKELKEQIHVLTEEKDSITAEKEKFRLELENKLESFESNLHTLSILEKYLADRSISIRQAYLWLEKRQMSLAEETCKILFKNSAIQVSDSEIEEFTYQIHDYLRAIGACLDNGRANLLDKVRANTPILFYPQLYTEVFKIIRDKKLPLEPLSDESKTELRIYLNHLIQLFKDESN